MVDAIKANVARQAPLDKKIKEVGNRVQLAQELGGLMGRIALAVLIILAVPRRLLLRLFQVPGLVLLPATYLALHQQGETAFAWGVALCGFVTVAQFSYFGEYLPKVFPLHLARHRSELRHERRRKNDRHQRRLHHHQPRR